MCPGGGQRSAVPRSSVVRPVRTGLGQIISLAGVDLVEIRLRALIRSIRAEEQR